jgi:hypothetical protein
VIYVIVVGGDGIILYVSIYIYIYIFINIINSLLCYIVHTQIFVRARMETIRMFVE